MTRGVVRYLFRALFMLMITSLCFPAIAGASGNRENKLFLTSSISNNLPYVGQEILLTYTLYFNDVAPKITNETPLSLREVWTKETLPERYIKSIPTSFQGKPFRSAIVKQFRLVPLQSGKITVSGYSILFTLPQEPTAEGEKELSDTRVRITAPDVILSAQAIPEPVPEGFSGAVGTFQLDLLSNKQILKAGEPLSLKLELTGTGSLHTLKLPDLRLPASFRQNPPEIATTLKTNSVPASGSITAAIISWPQSEGNYQIPVVSTVIFNPDTKQFKTLFTKSLHITVTPALQGTIKSKVSPLIATEQKNNLPPQLIATAIALLLLISGAALFLIKKHTAPTKSQHEGTVVRQTDLSTSAVNLKQLLFASLKKAGIKNPGGLTRMELKTALQDIGISDDIQSELTVMLDTLDKILYSPIRDKEAKAPELIVEKVNALSKALKPAGNTRT
jgi:hypothetical protein